MVEIDQLDKKILHALTVDSRLPLNDLSKTVGKSREVVGYRMDRLERLGVIKAFYTEMNTEKLGYSSAFLLLGTTIEGRQKILAELQSRSDVSWSSTWTGVWGVGMSLYGKNMREMDDKLLQILSDHESGISQHRFAFHKEITHLYERFFGKQSVQQGIESTSHVHDMTDLQILSLMARNSRITVAEISREVDLSQPAVSKRIQKLEFSGYIRKYSILIDWEKIGLSHYSIFIENNNIGRTSEFIEFLKDQKNVSFVVTYIGNPFVEFGVLVSEAQQLDQVLTVIKSAFPANTIFETSYLPEEVVSFGPPHEIFS